MLSVVGTPIGNMEDLSYRAARTILTADIILTEDTRSTHTLIHKIHELFGHILPQRELHHQPKIESYYKETELQKIPIINKWLSEGKNIVLISEAGMPLISDPGYLLMRTAIREGFTYTVIPGPSAVTTALIHSGAKFHEFMFIGFLPKKAGDVKRTLEKVKSAKALFPDSVYVAFESPHRIKETLSRIGEILPDADVTVARELTKKFEEILRGKADALQSEEYKGEITLVLS